MTQANFQRLAQQIAEWQRLQKQREQNAAQGLVQMSQQPPRRTRTLSRNNVTLPLSSMVQQPHRWNTNGVTIGPQKFTPLNAEDRSMFGKLQALPPRVRKAVTAKYIYDTRHSKARRRTRYSSVKPLIKAATLDGISGRALAANLNIEIPQGTGYKPHRHSPGLEKSVREYLLTGSIQYRHQGLHKSRVSPLS